MFARSPLVKLMPKVRQMSSISGPASNPISTPEKVVHGVVITVACLGIPAYIMTHLKDYRGEK